VENATFGEAMPAMFDILRWSPYVSLDRIKDGVVSARDLRLQFKFGGAADREQPSIPQKLDTATRLSFGQLWKLRGCRFPRFWADLQPGASG